jgi:hypothetical protein
MEGSAMRFGKLLTTPLIFGLLLLALSVIAQADEKEDVAITAFADAPLLQGSRPIVQTELSAVPFNEEMQLLDLNQDLNFNDFDVKQFHSIIESLNGSELTGLQLSTRFRMAQKNQKESFPLLYDLDRDGYFSPKDVDAFLGIVDELDEGASRGNELIQAYRMKIFPRAEQDKK